jgi:hypothetical protein
MRAWVLAHRAANKRQRRNNYKCTRTVQKYNLTWAYTYRTPIIILYNVANAYHSLTAPLWHHTAPLHLHLHLWLIAGYLGVLAKYPRGTAGVYIRGTGWVK